MEVAKASICLHFGNDGVDEGKEVVLSLAHQHTNLSVGERSVEKWGTSRARRVVSLSLLLYSFFVYSFILLYLSLLLC